MAEMDGRNETGREAGCLLANEKAGVLCFAAGTCRCRLHLAVAAETTDE
jgi:hypothetical protein